MDRRGFLKGAAGAIAAAGAAIVVPPVLITPKHGILVPGESISAAPVDLLNDEGVEIILKFDGIGSLIGGPALEGRWKVKDLTLTQMYEIPKIMKAGKWYEGLPNPNTMTVLFESMEDPRWTIC